MKRGLKLLHQLPRVADGLRCRTVPDEEGTETLDRRNLRYLRTSCRTVPDEEGTETGKTGTFPKSRHCCGTFPDEEGARGIVDGKFKIQDWARAHPR